MNFTNTPIRAIIADDEPAARTSLQILLSKREDVEILALCSDGRETVAAILNFKPDLVFLDIQMPELNGFEVLRAIQRSDLPAFIFVTAFDQFALQAFQESAVDYLLKPYDDERFYESLDRAKKQLTSHQLQDRLKRIEHLLESMQGPAALYATKLTVKTSQAVSFVPIDAIMVIESEGNFVSVRTKDGTRTADYTIKQLLEILDPKKFVRIHRSHMINIDFVEGLEPYFHGDYYVILNNGAKFKLSRNYKESFDRAMNPHQI